jgi:hypothetical protein
VYIYVIGGSIGIAKSELHISYLMEADIYVIGCSIVIVDSELDSYVMPVGVSIAPLSI